MAVTLFSLWTKSQLWWALGFSSLILPGETVTAEAAILSLECILTLQQLNTLGQY